MVFRTLVGFIGVEEVAAAGGKLGLDRVVHLVQHDDGLLGGADHAVVKGLGMNDGVDGQQHVGGVVDDGGGVARADAQGGLAAGIGRACTMPGPPVARMMSASFITRLVISSEGTSIQAMISSGAPAATAASSTTLAAAMVDFLARGWGLMMMPLRVFRAIRVLKMAVEVGLVVGITAAITPMGSAILRDAKGLVLLDYAAGLGILIGVVNVFGGVVVLDDLVLHHAHAGLLHGQLGQGDALLVGSDGGRQENAVYLLLRV